MDRGAWWAAVHGVTKSWKDYQGSAHAPTRYSLGAFQTLPQISIKVQGTIPNVLTRKLGLRKVTECVRADMVTGLPRWLIQ